MWAWPKLFLNLTETVLSLHTAGAREIELTNQDLAGGKNSSVLTSSYEPFCVSKLLFWCQKWVTGALHSNSLVVRRVSQGRIIFVLF